MLTVFMVQRMPICIGIICTNLGTLLLFMSIFRSYELMLVFQRRFLMWTWNVWSISLEKFLFSRTMNWCLLRLMNVLNLSLRRKILSFCFVIIKEIIYIGRCWCKALFTSFVTFVFLLMLYHIYYKTIIPYIRLWCIKAFIIRRFQWLVNLIMLILWSTAL